jgi:hypothetical protein
VGDTHRKTTSNLTVDENCQHFKRDQAKFWGEKYQFSDEDMSNKGSVFQDNYAEFYGMPKPEKGAKPYKVKMNNLMGDNKNNKKSVLNERRLKAHDLNMQRNPSFKKNQKRFWEMKSMSSR